MMRSDVSALGHSGAGSTGLKGPLLAEGLEVSEYGAAAAACEYLDVEDLEQRDEGIVITLRRSKTDQEGGGRLLGVPYGSNPKPAPSGTFAAGSRWPG